MNALDDLRAPLDAIVADVLGHLPRLHPVMGWTNPCPADRTWPRRILRHANNAELARRRNRLRVRGLVCDHEIYDH